jgi:HNH endonuclease
MMSYEDYICSVEWRMKATDAKRRAGWMCALCEETAELEVHHRTYRRLGREHPDDLVVLCGRCHRRHHGTFAECTERQLTLPMVPLGPELN